MSAAGDFTRRTRAGRATIVGATRALGPLRRPVAHTVGAAWHASRSSMERRRAARNFRRLIPALDADAAQRLARRSYRQYVEMIFDSIWADAMPNEQILRVVRVSGREHLDTGGRGGILAISHFGNWDMAASAALALGVRMTTVMARIITPGLTRMVALSRQRKGLELYTPQQAARGLLRALRRGRFVALMVDIPEAGPTVTVPYCGGEVRFSAVPARLAAVTGAPLLPVACWREGDHWALEIQPPLEVLEGDDEPAVMARIAAQLEPYVRRHPQQWYPFHEVYADSAAG
ncbi:MAG: lysophospholipid acyltransferase family protein [Candidatus Dormibacteraeota bacterium]|nr:lysophospholipid acyltransferase family protein [Candidatus Dormibacteraeota bacterium]MBV9525333.1 lysophospholipid acyltransferase family protein [Candidatus Dormibacteraeota bacterium]